MELQAPGCLRRLCPGILALWVPSWQRGTQPLVAREGSLEAQVDALPAGRDWEVGGDPALRIAGEGLGYHPRHLEPILKGKTPQTHPDGRSFSPVVSAGYKSSLSLL